MIHAINRTHKVLRHSFPNLFLANLFLVNLYLANLYLAMDSQSQTSYPRGEALIEVDALHDLIDQGNAKLVVLQATPTWPYLRHHLPGARQAWRPELGPQAFERWARRQGIDNDSQVVVVDTRYDATHLWWAFHHHGKNDVRVLNGGLQAWRSTGLPIERGPIGQLRRPGNFTAQAGLGFVIASTELVRDSQSNPNLRLWDTREPEEWSGAKRKWGAKRAGRIPWSTFLSWKTFRHSDSERTTFRSAEAISAAIECHGLDPAQRHIFYCQSGVRTTTAIFALYLMGWDPAHLINYCGSWIEWSRDPANPIQRDP
jgi:thiosulfate/3-mercaptopyruvate sulfurtransferase